ncbi:hypothetical protein BHF71_06985 [Vulcanibacillus modesticaldus]|uniref:SHS2 domain-containing protein n=1 Tax=Vulcanibacillus modesticaldus TaxID=337097 RepID=A0A1D2YWD0_9BACI|nr:cell division protein FtsA [Vulcanibacillus modesticaldus]OEG00010.1 hypothetical protein BHF71_06985 [Vulcanibacillus modesticaldus]
MTLRRNFVEEVTTVEQETAIFALDIGTRSVIGVILQPTSEGIFEIKDIKLAEHKERSMLDGQIHDVLAVSDTIKMVKKQLEADHGPLNNAAVAAAGRSLKTKRVTIDLNIDGQPLLRKEDIRALELSAVQEAQKQLIEEIKSDSATNYHCVGYSVVNYFLDDQIIGSLIDQRGKKASVEIIATFLPRVVVDSLISSLKRANLEMSALTLEPIAAIHVLIPPSMRKLNIAFVDIGAGTSDIAITAEGTIIAYGMVPFAGDEITEAISQSYILDFHIAEEIKRRISIQKEVTFTDILGMEYTISSEEIINQIDQEITKLADNISQRILDLNGKPPQAVILVGGGSQTPKLTEKIASLLDLPPQRVAVRGAEAIQHKIIWPKDTSKGPDLVTPIGIGISSRENPIKYISFYVNGETVRLFEMKSLTIGDALIAAGIPIKSLFGKPGMAMTVKINSKLIMIPGEHGTLPEITLNGETATLDTIIKSLDKIDVKPGKNGKNASLTLKQALKYSSIQPFNIQIEDQKIELLPLVEINGIDMDYSATIKDRDTINFHHVKNIEEALILAGYSTKPYTEKNISFQLDGKTQNLIYSARQIYQNGKPVNIKDPIHDGDIITFDKQDKPFPTIKDILQEETISGWEIGVTFNGQPIKIQSSSFKVFMNQKEVTLDSTIEPNSSIEIKLGNNQTLTFSDVFRYVDFDTTPPKGSIKYVIRINNQEADFKTPIKDGDKLELYWE